MNYWRCKCGKAESWESGMGPTKCFRCKDCGSGYGSSPNTHIDPVDHEFSLKEEHVGDDGTEIVISYCRYCMKRKSQIDEGH